MVEKFALLPDVQTKDFFHTNPVTMRIGFALLVLGLTVSGLAAQTVLQARFLGSLFGDSLAAHPLTTPSALALDPEGNLYLADTGNHRVIKCDPRGRLIREVGGFGFDTQQFDRPVDLWAGNGLEVLVADYNNQRVQRFDKDLNFISSLTASNTAGQDLLFGYPAAVALSPQGELFIADHEFRRVLRFDVFGKAKASFGDFNWGEGGLERPTKILISGAGEIFVSDSVRHAILIYDAFGNFIGTLGQGMLNRPCGLAEWRGLIWVADRGHCRIAGFNRSGELVFKFGRPDSTAPSLRAPVALALRSTSPPGGASQASGRAFVLDAGRNAVLVYELTQNSN